MNFVRVSQSQLDTPYPLKYSKNADTLPPLPTVTYMIPQSFGYLYVKVINKFNAS